jgi:hypothetical protein
MSVTDSPFERFKQFVAQILTVTKDDIQKVEDEATDLVKPEASEQAEE